MDLLLSDEQEELQTAIKKGIAKELPLERLHAGKGELHDADALRKFADLGWLRISLPEEHGGLGLTHAEDVILFRELGRNLGPLSLLAGGLAARVAIEGGQRELAEAILDGEREVGLIVEDNSAERAQPTATPARMFSSGACDLGILVLPNQATLVDVSDAAGPEVPGLDRTLSMHRFDLGRARSIAQHCTQELWWRGTVLAAAMSVGLAEGARDMILEYAKVRQTFGRPIGAYQAVRHPIADMTARAEHARCQTYYAALTLSMGRQDGAMQAAAARSVAEDAARQNAGVNIQLHGAVGITSELSAHHFLKRSIVFASLFGGRKAALRQVLEAQLMEV